MDVIKRQLRDVHNKYVIAAADKAANNYVIICKKYFITIMCKELGIQYNSDGLKCDGNQVYHPADNDHKSVIERHHKINSTFKLNIAANNSILPAIYGIPKMHKNPVKFRFIAAAKKCSTKELNILLHKVLAGMKKHFINYCNLVTHGTDRRLVWSVTNSEQAKMRLLRKRIKADTCITSADFATLYTSLPHALINEQICYLIDMLFKNAKKHYIHAYV